MKSYNRAELNQEISLSEQLSNFLKHLFKLKFLLVIFLFGLITSIIIFFDAYESKILSALIKGVFLGVLIYVTYSYKNTFWKKVLMFISAWVIYTIIVASLATVISSLTVKYKTINKVEIYIDQIVEKSKHVPLDARQGVKTIKIEKINKYTLKESSQFINFSKNDIFTSTLDIKSLKEETINNIKNSACEKNLKEPISLGMVYEIEQYDKNMVLLMSASVKKDCLIEVQFYNK